jgi:hypothetical protein
LFDVAISSRVTRETQPAIIEIQRCEVPEIMNLVWRLSHKLL